MRVIPHSLQYLALTGAITVVSFVGFLGAIVSLRHHRCGETELLPIDGDPKVLVEAIIRKQGGEEVLLKRFVGIVEFQEHNPDDPMKVSRCKEVFRYPDGLKIRWETVDPKSMQYTEPFNEHGVFEGLWWSSWNGSLDAQRGVLTLPWDEVFSITTYINPLLLRKGDIGLSIIGTRNIDNRETVGLRTVFPEDIGFRSRDFYFDRVDGRLLMTSITVAYACMPLTRIEANFREFATHDGVVWPSRWVTVEGFIPHPTMHTPDRKKKNDIHLRSAQFPSTLGDESFRRPSK